ncbi:MAG: DUF502 domain-containing protein [Candidatus Eisenbacteria bacterium]|nr:DUF502 domain-containing protein [Candidatus Eisenbacteria bacterium]
MRAVLRFLRSKLIAGVLFLIPLGVTYFVLKLIFNSVDNILAPYVENLIGRDIPGLGLAATLILVLLAGLVATNIFGRHMLSYIDRGLSKIPIVSGIYVSTKQFVEAIGATNTKSFKRVVLIEYPRRGLITFAFVTKDAYTVVGKDGTKCEVVNVFVPSTPNPTTGFLIILPKSQVIGVDLTVEEGVKMIVSGGIIVPYRMCQLEHTRAFADATELGSSPGGSGGKP